MALTTAKRKIDGIEFTICQLPARQAQRTLHRLSRTLFPGIGAVMGGFLEAKDADKRLADLEVGKILKGVSEGLPRFFACLTEDELMGLEEVFFTQVIAPGGDAWAQFDALFTGKPDAPLKLLWECIQVNYGVFLPGEVLVGLFGRLKAAFASRTGISPKTSESAGQSGGSSSSA